MCVSVYICNTYIGLAKPRDLLAVTAWASIVHVSPFLLSVERELEGERGRHQERGGGRERERERESENEYGGGRCDHVGFHRSRPPPPHPPAGGEGTGAVMRVSGVLPSAEAPVPSAEGASTQFPYSRVEVLSYFGPPRCDRVSLHRPRLSALSLSRVCTHSCARTFRETCLWLSLQGVECVHPRLVEF